LSSIPIWPSGRPASGSPNSHSSVDTVYRLDGLRQAFFAMGIKQDWHQREGARALGGFSAATTWDSQEPSSCWQLECLVCLSAHDHHVLRTVTYLEHVGSIMRGDDGASLSSAPDAIQTHMPEDAFELESLAESQR
jgi:hypothetical protein